MFTPIPYPFWYPDAYPPYPQIEPPMCPSFPTFKEDPLADSVPLDVQPPGFYPGPQLYPPFPYPFYGAAQPIPPVVCTPYNSPAYDAPVVMEDPKKGTETSPSYMDHFKPRKFSKEVVKLLNARYEACSYINGKERQNFAALLGLKVEQVKIWFQNRRYKDRKSGTRTTGHYPPAAMLPGQLQQTAYVDKSQNE